MEGLVDALWGVEPIRAVQEFFGAGWSWFFHIVTLLGAHETVALVVAMSLWLRGRRLAYAIVGIVAFVMVVDLVLWRTIDLPRPSGPMIEVRGTAPVSSFPSGHTVVATAVWGLLAFYRCIPLAVVPPIVLTVMLSRLYLGMHYLGDVLGGAMLGTLMTIGYGKFWPSLAGRLARLPFRVYLGLGLGIPACILLLTLVIPSPRVWVAFGAALGGGLGLPLEYWFVRSTPGTRRRWHQIVRAVTGIGVAAVMLIAGGRIGLSSALWDAAVFGAVALWLALGAPMLFVWLGLSDREGASIRKSSADRRAPEEPSSDLRSSSGEQSCQAQHNGKGV